MQDAVVIIGIGQMGGVFGRGLLRTGRPVFPVLRATPITDVYQQIPDPALVLVAVAEGDLDHVLMRMPDGWKGRLGLLQNELVPGDWEKHGVQNPTVIAAWFEKKFRSPIKPLTTSPIYGPQAEMLARSLSSLEIPVEILDRQEDLVSALVMKNLYILTANIASLQGADTTGVLLNEYSELTQAVFDDVLAIQEALTEQHFDREAMWEELEELFRSQPDHGARGRSAPQRLDRALTLADKLEIEVPALRRIERDN